MADARLIDVVEAAYALDRSERDWLEEINRAAAAAFDAPLGAFTYAFEVDAGSVRPGCAVFATDIDAERALRGMVEAATPDVVRHFFRYGPACGSMADAIAAIEELGASVDVAQSRFVAASRLADLFVVTMRGFGGTKVHVNFPHSETLGRTDEARRARWTRLSTHLSAGLRLRQASATEHAVLDPSGRVLHADADAKPVTARDALRAAVRDRERARGPLRRRDPERALAIWRGLIDGRWSLVDRFESDGRRFIVARPNEASARDPRALSRRERQVAMLLARGWTHKAIAYDLGIAASSVSSHAASVARKLGARGRADLVSVLRALPID